MSPCGRPSDVARSLPAPRGDRAGGGSAARSRGASFRFCRWRREQLPRALDRTVVVGSALSRECVCPLCGGRRRWWLWWPWRWRLWWPWRQHGATHSRFKSRRSGRDGHARLLCVGAVGEFFDFVTDCFIASSVPIDIRTPSTRPCSLRRNLIGRAKYTEPAGSLHETSSTPAWLLPERRVLHRHDRFPDRP